MDIEEPRGLAAVTLVHDVVAFKGGARLVRREVHRHAFGNARAHQRQNGGPPEVVRNATWAPGRTARGSPRFLDADNPLRLPVSVFPKEDEGAEVAGPLSSLVVGVAGE